MAAERWLTGQLDRVFPSAESLIQEMKLEERYKDVTFETLNRDDFLESVKDAFPNVDWDKAYGEFKAAGRERGKGPNRQVAIVGSPQQYELFCCRMLDVRLLAGPGKRDLQIFLGYFWGTCNCSNHET